MQPGAPSEDEHVARALAALGSPTRLGILRALRAPRRLGEIELQGAHVSAGGVISRQAVREHLTRLVEVGMVLERSAEGDARSTREFIVNHQAIFALVEELKGLARLRPVVEMPTPTAEMTPAPQREADGARLLLVKGLDEGLFFHVRPGSAPSNEWIIGRRRGLAVTLDFDPYVSAENAIIRWFGGRHMIRDGPESRNGTFVNLQALRPDEEHALRHGDLIGVGRSLLLYWS